MERVQFTDHEGCLILHIDLHEAEPEETLAVMDHAGSVIAVQPRDSVLTLTDVRDVVFNRESAEALRLFTEHNKPYVKAAAVVGVTGLKSVIYQAIVTITGRNIKIFDDLEGAKDWLSAEFCST